VLAATHTEINVNSAISTPEITSVTILESVDSRHAKSTGTKEEEEDTLIRQLGAQQKETQEPEPVQLISLPFALSPF
jgi:hypothetical protein